MKWLRTLSFATLFTATLFSLSLETRAESTQTTSPAKTVVLVHGAFADGSSWNKVIPILQASGLNTIAVQNPLTSLKDDARFTQRAIDEAEGSVVLVGHSWGGVVITEAGLDEKVQSLVYVSAFAPSTAEHLHDILADAHGIKKIPKVPGFKHPTLDKHGFLGLTEDTFIKHFAHDLPANTARLIAAGQGKLHKDTLDQRITKAAWETKPSWFVVSTQDHMIAPDLLRAQAKKIGATTIELKTSHVPMLSKPQEVANVIIAAAKSQK